VIHLGPKTTKEEGFLLGSLVDVSGFLVDVFKIHGFKTHQIILKTNISRENSWLEDEISS